MPAPDQIDRAIIAARLKGYLNKHQDAVDILSEAIAEHGDDVRLLRWRGHRRISVRDYDGAIADLTKAVELLPSTEDAYELYQKDVEPDAIKLILGRDGDILWHTLNFSEAAESEQLDRYMTTLHTSVYYHLGVALYLNGELQRAHDAFRQSYESSLHHEGKVASLDWLYMILRRLHREDEAAQVLAEFESLPPDVDNEEVGYEMRMQLYTGRISPDELRQTVSDNPLALATQGYGLANWYLVNGQPDAAEEIFDEVLATGTPHAFAYLAVESERARKGELAAAHN